MGEEQAKCSKTKYSWIKDSTGSCSKFEVGEAGCWGESYREKRRFGVAIIDNVWSYLACRPLCEEKDLLPGKVPATSLSFLPAFAPRRK